MHFRTATAVAALISAATLTPAFGLTLSLHGATTASTSSSSSSTSSGTSAGLGVDLGLTIDPALTLPAGLSSGTTLTASANAAAGAATEDPAAWGNVGLIVDLIQSSDWTSTSLTGLGNISAAAFAVDDASNIDARALLDATLGVYATDVAELQAAIAANAELSGWLAAQDIALDSVIAANVTAAGTLALYTD